MFYDQSDTSNLRRLGGSNTAKYIRGYDAVFTDYLNDVHAGSFSDDIEAIQGLSTKLKHLKKETSGKYVEDLMYPEKAMHAKIPNSIPFPTSSFKTHNTTTITPNALGNFMFTYNPYYLTGLGESTFMLNVEAGLTGGSTSGPYTAIAIGQQIPAIYNEYRLVSASIVVSPKNSMLNMQGTLSAGCIIDSNSVPVANATTSSYFNQYSNFTYTDDSYFNQIVPAKDGLRGLYFPLDVTYEQFLPIGQMKPGFTFLCYGQGLQASTPCIRVDFYCNWEATPQPAYLQFIPRSMPGFCSSDDKSKAVEQAQKNAVTKFDGTIPAKPQTGYDTKDISYDVDKAINAVGKVLDLANSLAQVNNTNTGKNNLSTSMIIDSGPGFSPSNIVDNGERASNALANAGKSALDVISTMMNTRNKFTGQSGSGFIGGY